jgi:hypothetical protein
MTKAPRAGSAGAPWDDAAKPGAAPLAASAAAARSKWRRLITVGLGIASSRVSRRSYYSTTQRAQCHAQRRAAAARHIKWAASHLPMGPGAFVTHFGKQVHFDGAKEEDATLLIVGEGPATATPAEVK